MVELFDMRGAALTVFWLASQGLGLRATYNAADDQLHLGWVATAAAAGYAGLSLNIFA